MIRRRIIELLNLAANEAQKSGKLPSVALPEITIEHPQNPEHGDYATSFPLKLARTIGVNPLNIAQDVADLIKPTPEIASVAVAPPGFINFTLADDWLTQQADAIRTAGDSYGNIDIGKGIAFDAQGYVYLAGQTKSFGPSPGNWSGFLLKYDWYGNQQAGWPTYYGGNYADLLIGLQPHYPSGNFYLIGETYSFAGYAGEYWSDVWLIKCDHSGNMIWDKTWGGGKDSRITGDARDDEPPRSPCPAVPRRRVRLDRRTSPHVVRPGPWRLGRPCRRKAHITDIGGQST